MEANAAIVAPPYNRKTANHLDYYLHSSRLVSETIPSTW